MGYKHKLIKFVLDFKDCIVFGIGVAILIIGISYGFEEAWGKFKHQWYLEAIDKLLMWASIGLAGGCFFIYAFHGPDEEPRFKVMEDK